MPLAGQTGVVVSAAAITAPIRTGEEIDDPFLVSAWTPSPARAGTDAQAQAGILTPLSKLISEDLIAGWCRTLSPESSFLEWTAKPIATSSVCCHPDWPAHERR
jgi:hypothetical protein